MAEDNYQKLLNQIKDNLDDVYARMGSAAEKSGRKVDDVKLIAVTKLMPVETIRAGIDAGIRCFGENYAEQAAEKITQGVADQHIEWHMIGHIQSRKTETVCQYFDMVHSVDRMKIARYLDRYARQLDKVMPVLLEVNLSGEESKYGWEASDEGRWEKLVQEFKKIAGYSNIEIRGLMSMPPLFEDPESTRPIYKRLRLFQEFLRQHLPGISWDELSIGTSFDYEVAIEEGATMVRIGKAIFGPRPKA